MSDSAADKGGSQPAKAASSPAHISGSVSESGSTVVSQSIIASTSSTATALHHSRVATEAPKRQPTSANSAAVSSSTAG